MSTSTDVVQLFDNQVQWQKEHCVGLIEPHVVSFFEVYVFNTQFCFFLHKFKLRAVSSTNWFVTNIDFSKSNPTRSSSSTNVSVLLNVPLLLIAWITWLTSYARPAGDGMRRATYILKQKVHSNYCVASTVTFPCTILTVSVTGDLCTSLANQKWPCTIALVHRLLVYTVIVRHMFTPKTSPTYRHCRQHCSLVTSRNCWMLWYHDCLFYGRCLFLIDIQ